MDVDDEDTVELDHQDAGALKNMACAPFSS